MTAPTPPQERFLDESVLADFTAMRMTAFRKSVIDIANDPTFDTWTFSQKVLFALDKEVAARRERRISKLLKASRSPNLTIAPRGDPSHATIKPVVQRGRKVERN